eukprot:COSAG02_NODE_3867_length_6121_cov_1.789937_6_plen_151_part_00
MPPGRKAFRSVANGPMPKPPPSRQQNEDAQTVFSQLLAETTQWFRDLRFLSPRETGLPVTCSRHAEGTYGYVTDSSSSTMIPGTFRHTPSGSLTLHSILPRLEASRPHSQRIFFGVPWSPPPTLHLTGRGLAQGLNLCVTKQAVYPAALS